MVIPKNTKSVMSLAMVVTHTNALLKLKNVGNPNLKQESHLAAATHKTSNYSTSFLQMVPQRSFATDDSGEPSPEPEPEHRVTNASYRLIPLPGAVPEVVGLRRLGAVEQITNSNMGHGLNTPPLGGEPRLPHWSALQNHSAGWQGFCAPMSPNDQGVALSCAGGACVALGAGAILGMAGHIDCGLLSGPLQLFEVGCDKLQNHMSSFGVGGITGMLSSITGSGVGQVTGWGWAKFCEHCCNISPDDDHPVNYVSGFLQCVGTGGLPGAVLCILSAADAKKWYELLVCGGIVGGTAVAGVFRNSRWCSSQFMAYCDLIPICPRRNPLTLSSGTGRERASSSQV